MTMPARTAAVIEDVEWLLDGGESVHHITKTIGLNAAALEKLLYRWDRHDLARRVGDERRRWKS